MACRATSSDTSTPNWHLERRPTARPLESRSKSIRPVPARFPAKLGNWGLGVPLYDCPMTLRDGISAERFHWNLWFIFLCAGHFDFPTKFSFSFKNLFHWFQEAVPMLNRSSLEFVFPSLGPWTTFGFRRTKRIPLQVVSKGTAIYYRLPGRVQGSSPVQ